MPPLVFQSDFLLLLAIFFDFLSSQNSSFPSAGVLKESKDIVLNDFAVSLVGLQAGAEFVHLRNSAH